MDNMIGKHDMDVMGYMVNIGDMVDMGNISDNG